MSIRESKEKCSHAHRTAKPILMFCKIIIATYILMLVPNMTIKAATYYTEGYYEYTIINDTISIHSYFGSENEVTVPETIAEKKVTNIEDFAFSGNSAVSSITLPESIESVAALSFEGADALKSVTIKSESTTLPALDGITIIKDFPKYVGDEETEKEKKDSPKSTPLPDKNPSTKNNTTDNNVGQPADDNLTTGVVANSDSGIDSDSGYDNGVDSSRVEENSVADNNSNFSSNNNSSSDDNSSSNVNSSGDDNSSNNDSSSSNNNTPLRFSDVKGISLDEGKTKVTVDDKGRLIEIDENDTITVLDDENQYKLNEQDDGTVTITDSEGNEVQINEKNNTISILNPILDFLIGIGIVVFGVWYTKKKKMGGKRVGK